jgi:hypothetical protein
VIKPGEKHDAGKPDLRLLPFAELSEVARVLTFGAAKYSEGGWRHVPNARQRYLSAALRHLGAYADGEELDAESGLHHVAHAACCLLFLLRFVGSQK